MHSQMNRDLILRAVAHQHPEDWVSQMNSAQLTRPRTRPTELPESDREAAVMLLISPDSDSQSLNFVLTRRKDNLQHHPGQISLPGGRRDPGETIQETAFREVKEEIGVAPDTVEIFGPLNSIYVPPSDFTVAPFVGWLSTKSDFDIQAEEVDELILVPIAQLLDPSRRKFSSVASDTNERDIPWLALQGHQVWGATAIILDDFSQRLQRELSNER